MSVLAAQKFEILFIFFCSLMLFTVGLSQQEVIGFETRFYLFAETMWQHGLTLFPTLYQQPYPDYPATAIILMIFMAKVMGGLTKLAIVFPSACAAAVTLVFTYLIGALRHPRLGVYAVCFLLMTHAFFATARSVSLDQYVTMVTTICFYLAYSAQALRSTQRLYYIPLFFSIGFAFRGPIGLIIPAAVLAVFYLLDKQIKQFFLVILSAVSVMLACLIILLAMAYCFAGTDFLQHVWNAELLGRIQDVKTEVAYFYFVEPWGAYAITYPLAFLLFLGLGKRLWAFELATDFKLIQKLFGWVLVILIGLSIPDDKKIRYALAMSPALALISAYIFMLEKPIFLKRLRKILYWFYYFFPLTLALLTCFLLLKKTKYLIDVHTYKGALVCFALLQIGIFYSHWLANKNKLVAEMQIVIAATLAFVIVYLFLVEPINLNLNRTHDFVESIENIRYRQHAPLVFYRGGMDGSALKYLIHMETEEQPVFLNTLSDLMQFGTKGIFVTDADYFSQIPLDIRKCFTVVRRGKIGHDEFVVFNKIAHPRLVEF